MTSALLFQRAQGRTKPRQQTPKPGLWIFISFHLYMGLALKSPSAAAISQSKMAPSGGTGLGGLPGKKKEKKALSMLS